MGHPVVIAGNEKVINSMIALRHGTSKNDQQKKRVGFQNSSFLLLSYPIQTLFIEI